jgi:outer membrane protein OmpA-like peptidoglycan-associated protein
VLFGSKPLPARTAKDAGLLVNDAFTGSSEERLLVAEKADGPRQTFVQLLVAKSFGFKSFGFEARGREEAGPAVLLEVVEIGAMEERMVTVDATAMAKGIAETGSVARYGIRFDTDKAVMKPESAEIIAEIAKLLQADPKLGLYVVGHTDDQGSLAYNLGLSRRRGQAVAEELVKKHGIAANRLTPARVAMLAPKAPNDSEEGRAKNRRVELARR